MLNNTFCNQQVGLLPINFLHNQSRDKNLYAMLNGSAHNFCVGYDYNYADDGVIRSKVWSANMTSYMSITPDKILLYDIYRSEPEPINTAEVERDVLRFYSYLATKKLRREDGVLELVLNQFKEIRSMLREADGARQSLSVLLYLLSKLDGVENIAWHLPDITGEAIERLSNSHVEQIASAMKEGLSRLSVRPNTDMILRHCSGALFQEANFIAHFPPQLSLFPTFDYSTERNPNLVGAYFTPSYIARTIVEESLRHLDLKRAGELVVFDPACGSGVFLSECLRQLKSKRYKGKIHVIGWDIDQIAIDMSNFVLYFEKQEWGEQLEYFIEQHNSLEMADKWPKCDLILMNPPFVSWAMMNTEQRRIVTDILGGESYRTNLSVIFYYLAARSLSDKGIIGSLMPSAFLTSDAISNVRQTINNEVPPLLIGQLGNYIFSSAFVDMSIVISQKGVNHEMVQFLWTKNSNNVSEEALRALRRSHVSQGNEASKDYHIYYDRIAEAIARDSWTPLSQNSIRLLQKLSWGLHNEWLVPVESLFDVRQGARTGANKIFTLTQDQYTSLPVRERKYFRPAVDNDAILNGEIEDMNYIFYPYPIEEKGFIDEDDLARKVPQYYDMWLRPNKDILIDRSGIDPNQWWLLTRPRFWQFTKFPKLVSTEFGRAGSYSIDVKGDFVVERGLCWMPRNGEMSMDEMFFYMSVLNSDFFNDLLLIYSKQLAGGAYNLETKYVNSIPVPIYDKVPAPLREILSTSAKFMLKGMSYDSQRVNLYVKQIYNAI